MFQIGPYADLDDKRFFVKMGYDYGNKGIQERGFLHVKSCTFEEIGRDDQVLFGPLELLHDGCPTKFEDVSFLENLRGEFAVKQVVQFFLGYLQNVPWTPPTAKPWT